MNNRNALIVATVLVALSGACVKRVKVEPLPPRPLSGMLAQAMVVLPVHFLRSGDSIGWTAQIPNSRAYLASFDSTLEKTLKDRGAPDSWRFPSELARAAQRNAGYVSNPYQLAAQPLRPPARVNTDQVIDPLASQVRAWTALNQSRVAILPIEIRFEGRRDSAQAVLRMVVIDATLSRISWMSDVKSEYGKSPIGEVLASLAKHVADLIAQP